MKKLGITIAATLIAASAVQADVLANWDNDALEAGATTAPVQATHADLSASDLTSAMPASNWPNALVVAQNNAAINSLATAISSDDYFSFTINPDAGKVVSYSDLFLRWSLGVNVTAATTEFTLLSSESGFTATDGIDTVTASGPDTFNVGTGTFDITGESALQSVAAGTAIEFRIYAHNTGANPSTRIGIGQAFGTNGTDDLTLNGTVAAIPEPATLGLFVFVAGGMLWIRRRFAI